MKLQLVTITALEVAGIGKYSSLLINKYVLPITQQEETLEKYEAELKVCVGNYYLKSTDSRKSLWKSPLTTDYSNFCTGVYAVRFYRLIKGSQRWNFLFHKNTLSK